MLCDCECEHKGNMYEESSPVCNGNGTLKCGICECYEGFFGKECECNSHQDLTGFEKHFQCRPDNISLVDCSGRGTCDCGQCECDERENPEEVFLKFSSTFLYDKLFFLFNLRIYNYLKIYFLLINVSNNNVLNEISIKKKYKQILKKEEIKMELKQM